MSVDKSGKSGEAIASKGDRVDSRDMETQDISKMVALDATRESQGMEVGSREQTMTFVKAFFATMSLSFARSHVNGFEKRDVQVFRGEQLYKKIVAASVARKNAERALFQAEKDKGEIQNESTAPLGKANASLSKVDRALSKAETNFKNAEDSLKGSISALLEYECHHGNTVDNLSERLKTDLGLYAGVSSELAQEVLSEIPKLVIVKMEEKIQGIASLKSFAKVEADKVAGALREPDTEVSRDAVSSTALRDGIVTFQKNIAAKVKELKLPLTKDEVSEIQTQALISVMPTIVARLPEISGSFEMDCKGMSGDIEKTLTLSSSRAKAGSIKSGRGTVKTYRESKAELLAAKKTAWTIFTEESSYAKVVKDLEKEDRDNLRVYDIDLKAAKNTRDKELARCDRGLADAKSKMKEAIDVNVTKLRHDLARAKVLYDRAVEKLDAVKVRGEANLKSLQDLLIGHKGSLIADKIANMKSMIGSVKSSSKPIILDVEEGFQRSSSYSSSIDVLSKMGLVTTDIRVSKLEATIQKIQKKISSSEIRVSKLEASLQKIQKKISSRLQILEDNAAARRTVFKDRVDFNLEGKPSVRLEMPVRSKEYEDKSEVDVQGLESYREEFLAVSAAQTAAAKENFEKVLDTIRIVERMDKKADKIAEIRGEVEMNIALHKEEFIQDVTNFIVNYNSAQSRIGKMFSFRYACLCYPEGYSDAVKIMKSLTPANKAWAEGKGMEIPVILPYRS
jgi:hypothetical protein